MYDHVKRRHETPTPEKRPREHGIEEGDGDDEGDEDIDGNESDDSQDDEEDDQQCQVNKYLLRKRRPVVNRYMAPPMSKKGGNHQKPFMCILTEKQSLILYYMQFSVDREERLSGCPEETPSQSTTSYVTT